MKRKNAGIAFLISTLVTIGLLMAILGKPNYVKHFNKKCHQMEMKQAQ